MTILAALLEPKKATVLMDTRNFRIGGVHGKDDSKICVHPYLGALSLVSGQSLANYNLNGLILRRKFKDFDQLLDEGAGFFEEVYDNTIDEMMEIEGFDDEDEFLQHCEDKYGFDRKGKSRVLNCTMALIGYSNRQGTMVASIAGSDDFEPTTVQAVRCFGQYNKAVTQCVERMGRYPKSPEDLKLILGYQWLSGEADGMSEGDGLGGGEVILYTIHSDRSIETKPVGTVEQCKALAKPVFDGKADTQPKPQGKTQAPGNGPGKPGRNAPCPCGSGKKYKKCCGRN